MQPDEQGVVTSGGCGVMVDPPEQGVVEGLPGVVELEQGVEAADAVVEIVGGLVAIVVVSVHALVVDKPEHGVVAALVGFC